jgi:hypothetical protein
MSAKRDRERAFRKKYMPTKPPYLGIMLRPEDCHALANGVVTATVQVLAADAIKTFWPGEGPR